MFKNTVKKNSTPLYINKKYLFTGKEVSVVRKPCNLSVEKIILNFVNEFLLLDFVLIYMYTCIENTLCICIYV